MAGTSPASDTATAADVRPNFGTWPERLWMCTDVTTWFKRLARNGFAVDWHYLHWLPLLSFMSLEFSFLRDMQRLFYGRRIVRAKVRPDPLFIIGHWRSGTTLLHELLCRDERHGYPTTYQCIAPTHFLFSQRIAMNLFARFVPKTRVMDNMALAWDRPQEDEFALVAMGLPSPYSSIAFPNHPPRDQEFYALEDVPAENRERWKAGMERFVRQVSVCTEKRLVFKSPTHTWRIPILLELFPEARFLHIMRDPYDVFVSTIHLWKKLYRRCSLQRPTFANLEENVFTTYLDMHRRLEATKRLVPPGRFAEVRFENLIREPVAQLRTIYKRLNLGDIEPALPAIQRYLAEIAGYEQNRYALTDEKRQEIGRRWRSVFNKYGYATVSAGA